MNNSRRIGRSFVINNSVISKSIKSHAGLLQRRRVRKGLLHRCSDRITLELLEDRTLLNHGQWYGVFEGMAPGVTLEEQAQYGDSLIHSSGLLDQDVHITAALDLSGTFVVQTPPGVTQQTVTSELSGVPGFVFVADYELNGDPNSPDGRAERIRPSGRLTTTDS